MLLFFMFFMSVLSESSNDQDLEVYQCSKVILIDHTEYKRLDTKRIEKPHGPDAKVLQRPSSNTQVIGKRLQLRRKTGRVIYPFSEIKY
jgi:hypothetical protein